MFVYTTFLFAVLLDSVETLRNRISADSAPLLLCALPLREVVVLAYSVFCCF